MEKNKLLIARSGRKELSNKTATQTKKAEERVEKEDKEKTELVNLIKKDYAINLVHYMLRSNDTQSILSAKSRLQFYDNRLRQMGLRATIKVGIEKIE